MRGIRRERRWVLVRARGEGNEPVDLFTRGGVKL